MTVTATSYTPITYNGNGSTSVFSVTFQFYEIAVIHIDSSGSETEWTENTHYTVTGGEGSTGSITVTTTLPATGEQLRIERRTSKDQPRDYDLDNEVLEDALQQSDDRLAMILQEVDFDNRRRPAISKSNFTAEVEFPAASTGSVLSWASDGNLANTALVDLEGVAISALTQTAGLEDTDLLPLYDNSAGDNAAITWANVKTAVTTALNLGSLASLDEVPDNSITSEKIPDGEITSEKLADGVIPAPQGKNLIINGNFDIWQRGTSQATSEYGSDDRWKNVHAGTTKTASRQEFALGQTDVPNNPKYYSRTVVSTVAGAGNYCSKNQKIEYVRTASGQTVTLSFWAKADATKSLAVELVQQFGTGGSPSGPIEAIGAQKVSLTTSWQKFTLTITIPTIAGKTVGTNNDDALVVLFWFDAGSDFDSRTDTLGHQSGTFDIAQVQLEAGDVATEFDFKTSAEVLFQCERYLEFLADGLALGSQIYTGSHSGSSGGSAGTWPFKVRKRTIPTVVLAAGSSGLNTVSRDHIGVFDGFNTYSKINAGTYVECEL